MAAAGGPGGGGRGRAGGRRGAAARAAPLAPSDVAAFKELLDKLGAAAPEEVPSLLTGKLDLLLSKDIAGLWAEAVVGRSDEEKVELEELMDAVVAFLEELAEATKELSEQNQALLRAILEAARAGEQALDALMRQMVGGEDGRYTPEFLRFLDAEIARLSAQAARGGMAETARDARPRYASQDSALGKLDAPDDEEEDERMGVRGADALSASRTLAMVKVRITAEMEATLGEDAWAAQLLARLLQVDQESLRVIALETALREMPDAFARAQFLDVARTSYEEVSSAGAGGNIDPELIQRLQFLSEKTASALGLKGG